MLHAGVAIQRAFDTVARKTSHAPTRRALEQVALAITQGDDVSSALRSQAGCFPDLFIDLVDVAEQTGSLPEVLAGLAAHYDNLVNLRRTFLSSIAWPIIQLFGAIFVVALLIWVLGIVGQMGGARPGEKPLDMLGWGLVGPTGAVLWLTLSFGTLGALVGGYFAAARLFRKQRFLDGLLMRIPIVGTCMRAFAIARFSWAYALTQQSGMLILTSLEASLRATGNGVFVASAPQVCDLVNAGEDLSTALASAPLFPDDYLQMVQVAETSGTVPEMLQHLSPQFEDQARRSLKALAELMGWVVWGLVALLIVFIVFSIFLRYVGMINELTGGH